MSGLFGKKEEPEQVNTAGEKAKVQRERMAKLQRSAFNKNTRTSGAKGDTSESNTFRSTLGG
tara:strand:+ start:854 stop:1039 length:186 start_codon:yes stop_codon:yes gene_type:complete